MTDVEPTHSLLINGYSKRIQDLIQTTKNKISFYGSNYALKNEKINNAINKITEISHPYIQQYGQYFNGKLEIAKNYVPNKLDLNVLENFQATREKVLVLSDKFLTHAEDQVSVLYHSLDLKEEKAVAIVQSEVKAIKPRVQALLRKSNVLLVSLMSKLYEELRSKNFNKENILKALTQLKEKIQSFEKVDDLKILTEMFYEHLKTQWISPSVEMLTRGKEVLIQIPTQLKTLDLKILVDKCKDRFQELKDATFVFYKDRVIILMNQDSLKQFGANSLEFLKKKVELMREMDLKKKGLELLDDGKERSMDLYNVAKKKLVEKREMIQKAFNEKKFAKTIKGKAIEFEQMLPDLKMKERQEKILEELETERLEKLAEEEPEMKSAKEEEEN